jgi:hypothetical protein
MKINTSELTRAALDWVVASFCEYKGRHNEASKEDGVIVFYPPPSRSWFKFAPSTDWSQGGPIIEREKIAIGFDGASWTAIIQTPPMVMDYEDQQYGATALIAAMRCLVASRLGEVVDVPEELMK